MTDIICSDGLCPYVPCIRFPKCNHLKKQLELEKEIEGKYYD